MSVVTSVWLPYANTVEAGTIRLATDGEYNSGEAVSASDGRLAGPWTAIDMSTGTVALTAPTRGFTWEIVLFIASSEAVTTGNMAGNINAETTATNYWTQQIVGTNAASSVGENNSNTLLAYCGSTASTGARCFNRILIPGFRETYLKMMLNTCVGLVRAAGDALIGQRNCYRTGAASGTVNEAITAWGYTLPNAGTHAAGSIGFHRWVSA